MLEMKIGLTEEEFARLRKYSHLVVGSRGRIDILTAVEKIEFRELLEKSMLAQSSSYGEEFTEE